MTLKFYRLKEPGGYMSNYHKARFYIYNKWWDSVEHAYQAQKCSDPIEAEAIHQAKGPNAARLMGQKVKMRDHWDDIHKERVMEECVQAKFLQHKDLRQQLIATGDEELVEDSPVDYFWGCGADGTGKNMLGKLLMKIRKELQGE